MEWCFLLRTQCDSHGCHTSTLLLLFFTRAIPVLCSTALGVLEETGCPSACWGLDLTMSTWQRKRHHEERNEQIIIDVRWNWGIDDNCSTSALIIAELTLMWWLSLRGEWLIFPTGIPIYDVYHMAATWIRVPLFYVCFLECALNRRVY